MIDCCPTDDTLTQKARFPDLLPRIISGQDSGIHDDMNEGLEQAAGGVVCCFPGSHHVVQPDRRTLFSCARYEGVESLA